MSGATYERDDAGNVIDPPVLRDHEQRIGDAMAAADQDMIDVLNERYQNERHDLADEVNKAAADDGDDGDDGDRRGDDDVNPDDYSYDDLRKMASARDLDTTGNKAELAARINAHDADGGE